MLMVNMLDLILSHYVYGGRSRESVSWTQIVKNQWERSTPDATDRKGHRCLLNPAITVDVGDATTSPMQDRSILGPFHGEGFPAQGAEG